ncbi:MAG: hypothetical protein NVS1B4_18360 [Gemmatimonadaceae bacterium]
MMKYVFVLVVGVAVGYFYGFADGRVNVENIVLRTVAQISGKGGQFMGNDVDKQMERLEGKAR